MIPYPVPIPIGAAIEDTKRDDARKEITRLEDVVAELERRVEKQAVLLRAVFALLSQRQGFTEADLLARYRQVEADRASAPPKRCSRCGRGVSVRHNRCLYCDEACPVQSAFELLAMGAWPDLSLPGIAGEAQQHEKQRITTQPKCD